MSSEILKCEQNVHFRINEIQFSHLHFTGKETEKREVNLAKVPQLVSGSAEAITGLTPKLCFFTGLLQGDPVTTQGF